MRDFTGLAILTPNHDGEWTLLTDRNLEQTQRALILSRTPDAGKSPGKGRLLGGSKPTCGPLPAASSLGFTGFFFPLLQPMFPELRELDPRSSWLSLGPPNVAG